MRLISEPDQKARELGNAYRKLNPIAYSFYKYGKDCWASGWDRRNMINHRKGAQQVVRSSTICVILDQQRVEPAERVVLYAVKADTWTAGEREEVF